MLIEKIDRYGRERGARSTALLFTPHALNFAKYGQTDLSDVRRVRDRNQLIVDELGDRARVLEMLIDGDAVASLQFNLHDDIYYARLVGILDTVPKSLAVYFNLAFYSLVELACAEQVKRMCMRRNCPAPRRAAGVPPRSRISGCVAPNRACQPGSRPSARPST